MCLYDGGWGWGAGSRVMLPHTCACQRTILCSQFFSFYLYMVSGCWTWISSLAQQAPLPNEPFCPCPILICSYLRLLLSPGLPQCVFHVYKILNDLLSYISKHCPLWPNHTNIQNVINFGGRLQLITFKTHKMELLCYEMGWLFSADYISYTLFHLAYQP